MGWPSYREDLIERRDEAFALADQIRQLQSATLTGLFDELRNELLAGAEGLRTAWQDIWPYLDAITASSEAALVDAIAKRDAELARSHDEVGSLNRQLSILRAKLEQAHSRDYNQGFAAGRAHERGHADSRLVAENESLRGQLRIMANESPAIPGGAIAAKAVGQPDSSEFGRSTPTNQGPTDEELLREADRLRPETLRG